MWYSIIIHTCRENAQRNFRYSQFGTLEGNTGKKLINSILCPFSTPLTHYIIARSFNIMKSRWTHTALLSEACKCTVLVHIMLTAALSTSWCTAQKQKTLTCHQHRSSDISFYVWSQQNQRTTLIEWTMLVLYRLYTIPFRWWCCGLSTAARRGISRSCRDPGRPPRRRPARKPPRARTATSYRHPYSDPAGRWCRQGKRWGKGLYCIVLEVLYGIVWYGIVLFCKCIILYFEYCMVLYCIITIYSVWYRIVLYCIALFNTGISLWQDKGGKGVKVMLIISGTQPFITRHKN